jgi:hypothetical protein
MLAGAWARTFAACRSHSATIRSSISMRRSFADFGRSAEVVERGLSAAHISHFLAMPFG